MSEAWGVWEFGIWGLDTRRGLVTRGFVIKALVFEFKDSKAFKSCSLGLT